MSLFLARTMRNWYEIGALNGPKVRPPPVFFHKPCCTFDLCKCIEIALRAFSLLHLKAGICGSLGLVGMPFKNCSPEAIQLLDDEGLECYTSWFSSASMPPTVLPQKDSLWPLPGLMAFPTKFWDQVAKLLFSKEDSQVGMIYMEIFFWIYDLFSPKRWQRILWATARKPWMMRRSGILSPTTSNGGLSTNLLCTFASALLQEVFPLEVFLIVSKQPLVKWHYWARCQTHLVLVNKNLRIARWNWWYFWSCWTQRHSWDRKVDTDDTGLVWPMREKILVASFSMQLLMCLPICYFFTACIECSKRSIISDRSIEPPRRWAIASAYVRQLLNLLRCLQRPVVKGEGKCGAWVCWFFQHTAWILLAGFIFRNWEQ